MNGRGSSTATTAFSAASSASVTPKAITSSKTVQVAEKSEVLKLKKRIEEMTKNMDKLTEMVQKVTLQHHQQDEFNPGMKRKKTIPSVECQAMDIPMPDAALSAMDMEELDLTLPPATVFSMDIPSPSPPPLMQPPSRESSDNEFVDQLFTAFHEDDDAADWLNSTSNEDWLASELTGTSSDSRHTSSNRPDPELMKRLSDALELLPREIQEMIVNRLIAAIISTDGFDVAVPSSSTEATTAPTVLVPAVVVPPPLPPQVDPKKVATASKVFPEDQPLPLAAATLAALLHHYSNQIKDGAPKKSLKSLPVIPVHA